MRSTVIIVPAALVDKANSLGEAMGYGSKNYSVPIAPIGSDAITHYGLHTYATKQFIDWLTRAEPLPSWAAEAEQVIDHLIVSVSDDAQGRAHFDSVLFSHGLHQPPDIGISMV